MSYLYKGSFAQVLTLKKDLLRSMEQRLDLRWYVRGLSAVSRAYSCLGHWNDAIKEGKNALRIAEKYSDKSQISFAAWTLSVAYSFKGDLPRAVEYGEMAVQKAPPGGDKAWAQRYLGLGLCRAGDLNRGTELLTAGLSLSKAGHWMPGVIPTICALGEAYWLSGDHNKAKRTLEEGLEILERCGAKYYIGFAHRLVGEMALKNKPAQAAPHFEKSIAILREIKAENELALAYAGYGRFHKQKGQIAKAWEYLMKALEIFERLGTLIEPGQVREELDELPDD